MSDEEASTRDEKRTTLVVAAWAPELPRQSGLVARALGIGLVEAAGGAARVLDELRPARVVLVGTAGALPGSGLDVGALVVADWARLVVRAVEYLPAPMVDSATADPTWTRELARRSGAQRVRVVCPLGITRDDAEAARLAGEAEVEHLECFALLSEAARRGIPAAALFAIANRVGAGAAAEWRANRVKAEAIASEALLAALR